MKNVLLLSLALLTTLPALSANVSAEVGQYNIDPMHSKVGFEISHLVISTVEGAFKDFEGQINIDKQFTKSTVSAKVKVDSIDTAVADRDKHLKSADFFDTAKFKDMSFESTEIKGTEKDFKLTGNLTIKGVKKLVTFKGKYLGAVTDGYKNRKVALEAETKINRKDFGLTWSSLVEAGPVVGDEVTLKLKIQGGKKADAKTTTEKTL